MSIDSGWSVSALQYISIVYMNIQIGQLLQSHQSPVEGPCRQSDFIDLFQFSRQHLLLSHHSPTILSGIFLNNTLPLNRIIKKKIPFCSVYFYHLWLKLRKGGREGGGCQGRREEVGVCDWLACERHKDNRVIFEDQPPKQPLCFCGSFRPGRCARLA